MSRPERRFLRVADLETASQVAAQTIARTLVRAVDARSAASLVLAGGSTPRAIHSRLADPELSPPIPWARVHVFWGDERCVPPDDDASNFGMARATLLDLIEIPGENIHRIQGELSPGAAAEQYETELRRYFGDQDPPAFDCVMLGMGADGHTASLFPCEPLADETERWVGSTDGATASPPVPRVSLTLPAFNAAHTVVFVVSGEAKRRVVHDIEERVEGYRRYPVARVRATAFTFWLVVENP